MKIRTSDHFPCSLYKSIKVSKSNVKVMRLFATVGGRKVDLFGNKRCSWVFYAFLCAAYFSKGKPLPLTTKSFFIFLHQSLRVAAEHIIFSNVYFLFQKTSSLNNVLFNKLQHAQCRIFLDNVLPFLKRAFYFCYSKY